MEGGATLKSLEEFKVLMMLRYSATHKTTHNKIHRLDALDAYNQKLVKKIAVRGISVNGLAGTNAYLYLQSIEISTKKPSRVYQKTNFPVQNPSLQGGAGFGRGVCCPVQTPCERWSRTGGTLDH
jgi:restriction endonuclease